MTDNPTYFGSETVQLHNCDNMLFEFITGVNLVFADFVYENLDFSWADKYFGMLENDGVLIAMTDWHSQHRFRVYMEDKLGAIFVNHLVWKNEWGNHPKDRCHQCYDDILIYAKSSTWNFYSDRIQVPKATANTKLNPSGRMTKTATAWIDGITLLTTSPERIKYDGKNVQWQKPLALVHRLIAPFVDADDLIVDPFMGVGTAGIVARQLGCRYIGIEKNPIIYSLALKRMTDEQ